MIDSIEELSLKEENERLKEELDSLKQQLAQQTVSPASIKAEQEAHQMMRAIFRELPSAILIKDIDDDYKFYIINKKFEQMCNMPQEMLIGKTDYEVFPKDEADKYRRDDTAASVYTEDDPMLITEIVTSPDRDVSTHLRTVKFGFSFKGKRLLICVGDDVTVQHQMMDKLQKALFKAEQADKLKSAFLANMSHEIRTPLNAIVGFSELLTDCQDPEERKEYQMIISQNNNLLLQLIGDILELSKIESGIVELKPEIFDLSSLYDEIYTTFRQRSIGKDFELRIGNPYRRCIVSLDKNKLIQIVNNFLTNAFKFTIKGHILLGYEYVKGGIRLYVEDTGKGIPKDKRELVFNRFEKLDDFAQGTGLGLSICKAIVEANKGEIGVDSEDGKGSTFWAWIPCEATISQ